MMINTSTPRRRTNISSFSIRRTNETMRLIVMTFVGLIFGFFLGASFPMFSWTKVHLPSGIFPSIDLTDIEEKYSGLSTQALLNVWSFLRGHGGDSHKFNNAKANICFLCKSSSWSICFLNTLLQSLLQSSRRVNKLECWRHHNYKSCMAHTEGEVHLPLSSNNLFFSYFTQIWVPTNPRGAERLPPGIIVLESDYYMHRLYGNPGEDLFIKPKYLVTFTVGFDQKKNIDSAVKKLTEDFTILLFHYDGRTSEWSEFEWSKRAIHVSVQKQAKWWYAKRFLHPDIVAPYDYIFIWDEDLGVKNFDPEEYIKLVKKHDLDISQPGLSPDSGMTWQMTRKREETEVHKDTEERPGWCEDPHLPPCAAFVEIMAPVFSRNAWRCVWHMIQNDLVHGWGLDFALRKCVEPAHEKIGVVDAQWIEHQSVPSLGNQGKAENGKASWEGVRERCRNEWTIFQDRMSAAEKGYYEEMGIDPPNSTSR